MTCWVGVVRWGLSSSFIPWTGSRKRSSEVERVSLNALGLNIFAGRDQTDLNKCCQLMERMFGIGVHRSLVLHVFVARSRCGNHRSLAFQSKQARHPFFWIFAWSCRVLSATQYSTCQKCSSKQDTTICQNMSVYHLAETNMPKHAKTWQWTTWSIFGNQTWKHVCRPAVRSVWANRTPNMPNHVRIPPVKHIWINKHQTWQHTSWRKVKNTEPMSLTSNMRQCCHIFPQTTWIQPPPWRQSAKPQTPPPRAVQHKKSLTNGNPDYATMCPWTTVLYNSQNSQTMPHVLYLLSICKARLMFWTWHDTSLARNSCNGHAHQTSYVLHTLHTLHHTSYVLHYFEFSPLLSDISSDILSDILSLTFFLNFLQTYLLTFFLTYLLTFSLTHLLTFSLTHLLTFFLTYLRSWDPARHTEHTWSRLRSGTPHWTHMIAVEVRHATLNSQDRGWGPARHTELTWSQLRSGTPHWTHTIAVEVRHATLNTHDRGWGPARHTELTWSQLRSGTPHWTHRIAVEVRHATLNSHGRKRRTRTRRRRRRRRRGGGGRQVADIKSNNPHLTGGEKHQSLLQA